MKYVISFFVAILIVSSSVFAQSENTAPVVWERYKLRDERLSVMLPKMPTATSYDRPCLETRETHYWAYADGIVYEVVLGEKLPVNPRLQGMCQGTAKFGAESIGVHIQDLGKRYKGSTFSKSTLNGLEAVIITDEASVVWLILDMAKNSRWIEVAAHRYPDSKTDLKQFLSSVRFDSSDGKPIDEGAKTILGDPLVAAAAEPPSADAVKTPYRIVSKPRPKYTDRARREQVTGTVTLKVELLSNGSAGTITPVGKKLGGGLDEEAVYAARRIAFLPKRLNGVPVDVTVTIEYGFTIY